MLGAVMIGFALSGFYRSPIADSEPTPGSSELIRLMQKAYNTIYQRQPGNPVIYVPRERYDSLPPEVCRILGIVRTERL